MRISDWSSDVCSSDLLSRRWPAALADRLGLCRLQLAALRPRRPRFQQPALAGAGRLAAGGLLRAAGRRRPAPPLSGDEVRFVAARDTVVYGLRNPLRHRLRLPGLHRREPGALPGRSSSLSAELRPDMAKFPSKAQT